MQQRTTEISVGFFMLLAILAMIFLALKVSGLSNLFSNQSYFILASFDNIGDLKTRAPVTIGGVRIGTVSHIQLDQQTFRANVTMEINKNVNDLPTDSSAQILTQGLLGANYISINPGFDTTYLKNGQTMDNTHSALILENLIGQLLFKVTNSDSTANSNSASTENTVNTMQPATAHQ